MPPIEGKGAGSRGSRQLADVEAVLTEAEVLDRTLGDLVADLPVVVDPDRFVVAAAELGQPFDELTMRDVRVISLQLVLQRPVVFDHDVVRPVLLPPGDKVEIG